MMRTSSHRIFVPILFLIIFVISFRNILFDAGIIGHTWDWGIPDFVQQFNIQFNSKLFLWDAHWQTGLYSIFKGELPFWIFLSFFSFLGGAVISKLLSLLLLIATGIISTNVAKKNFQLSWFWACAIGAMYAFSPFSYSRLIAGHITILVGYAALPLVVDFIFRLSKKDSLKEQSLLFIGFIPISLFLTLHFLPIVVSLVICLISIVWISKKHDLVRLIKTLLLVFPLYLFVHAYWLWPIVQSYLLSGTVYIRSNETIIEEAVRRVNYFQNISQSITGIVTSQVPFGLHTEFVYPVDGLQSIFIIVSSLLFVVAFGSVLVFKKSKDNCFLIFLYFLFLFGVGLSTGAKTIIGQTVYALLLKVAMPLFAGFSNPLRFLPLVYLPLPLLVVFTLSELERRFWQYRIPLIKLAVVVLLFVFWYPWLFRPLTKPVVPDDSQPLSLKVTQTNPEDKEVFDSLAADETDSRFAFLPPSFLSWPGETDHSFSWTSTYYPKPVFLQYYQEPLSMIILNQLYGQNGSRDLAKLLGLASVKTIIYPHYQEFESYQSFIPKVTNYKPYVDRNWEKQVSIRKQQSELKTIDMFSNEFFVPHIYIPTQTTYADSPDHQALVGISEQSAYELRNAVFFSHENIGQKIKRLETLDKSNVIYAQPLCAGCEVPKILDYELNPAPRFLPTSIFYVYTKWKEQRLINAVKADDNLHAYTDLVLATKKLAETRAMIKNKSDKYPIATQSLERYKQLLADFENTFEKIQKQGLSINEDILKYLVYFNKHLDELDQIILTSQNGDIVKLAETVRNYLSDVYQDVRIKAWRTDDTSDYKYIFSVPIAGEYQMLQKVSEGGLKPYKIEVDGKDIVQKSTTSSGEWAKVDSIELNPGSHTLRALLPIRENQFSGFQASPAITKLQDSTIMLSSQRDVIQVSTIVQKLDDRFLYRVSFDCRVIGDSIRFTIEQANDDVNKGKVHRKVDTLLSDRDRWINVNLQFNPNFGNTEAIMKFYLPATKVSTYLLRNMRIEQIDKPEYLFQKKQFDDMTQIPNIIFTKMNPTKYNVSVSGAEQPYFLVFSESFHEGWKAYIGDTGNSKLETLKSKIIASYFNGKIWEGEHKNIFFDPELFTNVFKKPIPEENHLLVNTYANAWYIDKPGDYEITLEFVPQRTYFVALMISGVTFVAVVLGLGILLIKKKRYGAN